MLARAGILVVDSNELRGLATAARTQGARIKADEGRAARIIIFGGPYSLAAMFHPFDLANLPNAPVEWQHLLADLPPGWSELTRRQRLALIDLAPFGALGYTPYAAPPPPPKPEHHSWFHNLWHGAADDLGDAAKWTLRQGEDFGNTFWSAGKGAVNYADEWLKAIFRTGINSTYELQHGALTDPLHAPPPLLPGPQIDDLAKQLPSDMFHGLAQESQGGGAAERRVAARKNARTRRRPPVGREARVNPEGPATTERLEPQRCGERPGSVATELES